MLRLPEDQKRVRVRLVEAAAEAVEVEEALEEAVIAAETAEAMQGSLQVEREEPAAPEVVAAVMRPGAGVEAEVAARADPSGPSYGSKGICPGSSNRYRSEPV